MLTTVAEILIKAQLLASDISSSDGALIITSLSSMSNLSPILRLIFLLFIVLSEVLL